MRVLEGLGYSAVVKHALEEILELGRLHKLAELGRNFLLGVVFLVFEHLLEGDICGGLK